MSRTTTAGPGSGDPLRILIRSWVWLHIASLSAAIIQPSTPAVFLGRYSRTSILVLLALAVSLPLVIGLVHRLENRTAWGPPALIRGPFLIPAAALALFFLWAFEGGSETPSYLVIRLYLTAALVTLGLWNVSRAGALRGVTSTELPHTTGVVLGVVIAGLIGLLSWALPFPGLLWTDEGYNTSLALSFVRTGTLSAPIVDVAPWLQGPNYSLVYMGLGVWYRLFGVDLGTARVFTLLIGVAGVLLLYRSAARTYAPAASVIAAIVTLLAFVPSNFLRADVAVMVYLGLACYWFVLARPDASWQHLLVGLASGFVLDGHPNAYRFTLVFTLAYFLKYRRALVSRSGLYPLLLLLVGQLGGLALYVGLYGSVSPGRFFSRVGAARFALDAAAVPSVWTEQVLSALQNAPLLFGIALLGIVAALKRRNDLDRLLLLTVGVTPIALGFLYGYYRDYYLMHMLVPMGLLGAGAMQDLIARFAPDRQRAVTAALAILIVAAGTGRLGSELRGSARQDYHEALDVADQIRTLVPRDDTFVGVDPFYFRMHDYPRFVAFNAGVALAARENISEAAVWERIHPDAVALVSRYPIAMPASLRAYVRARGFVRAGLWSNPKLGMVELYTQRPIIVPAPKK